MANIGKFRIENYQVTLPGGETVTRRQIIYLNRFDKEISREQYEDKPVDTNFVDPKDPTYAVNQLTFTYDASEDWDNCEGVTNRFIKRAGGTYTNITPFIAWQDCILLGIALSSREASDWTAIIYVNGEEAVRLKSEGNSYAVGRYEYKIAGGSSISIYVEGESIHNPGVQLILSAILPQKDKED